MQYLLSMENMFVSFSIINPSKICFCLMVCMQDFPSIVFTKKVDSNGGKHFYTKRETSKSAKILTTKYCVNICTRQKNNNILW